MIYFEISLPEGFGRPAILYVPDSEEEIPSYPYYGVGTGTHSYDSEGALLCWNSGLSCVHACDMEYLSRSSGLHLVLQEEFGTANQDDFLWRWVTTEVLAKMHNVPIVYWTQEHGLSLRLELEQEHILGKARLFLTQCQGRAMAFGLLEE